MPRIHANARTTPRIRREIQHAPAIQLSRGCQAHWDPSAHRGEMA